MKKKFDPNQQRNPSGSPEGGQWVSESETAQKWGSLRANAQEWVDKLKAQNNRYTSFANDAIYDARKGLLLHAKNATDPEEKAKWQLRLDESKAELARRADMGKYTRRLAAIDEGIRTGKLTIHRDEMAEILANQGDVYRDHGFSGDHEYDPELFVTSDLSGRPIRHYVTLPDGRIAHPDELHGSQYKGRIVVIDKFDGAGDLAKHMGANRSRRAKRAARHEAMKRQPVDVAMGKGGGGSGNFGHKGRPGLVGGSTRLQDEPNWKLQSQSYKPTMRYAKKYFGQFRAPTEEEAANFQKMMENIHPDLQKLWIGWSSENPKPLETMLLVSDEYAGR